MADFNDVLERLVTDAGFRRRLREDPEAALEGYDLDETELGMLAAQITEGAGEGGALEKRTSKSALAGLLGLGGGGKTHAVEKLTLVFEGVDADEPGVEDLASQPPEAEETEYLQIEMKPVFITSIQPTGDQPDIDDLTADQPPPEEAGKVNVQDLSLTKVADKSTILNAEQPNVDDLAAAEQGETQGDGTSNTVSLSEARDTSQGGDPDRPYVVGSLWNAEEDPPQGDAEGLNPPVLDARSYTQLPNESDQHEDPVITDEDAPGDDTQEDGVRPYDLMTSWPKSSDGSEDSLAVEPEGDDASRDA